MNPLIATLLSGGRASPAVLGSLLVATVGSQQANQIQNELALGNITLDDVYNLITNLAASPSVTALKDLEKSNQVPPKKDDDKTPTPPEPDPLDLLNLINTDRKKEDEKELTTISKGEETKESVSSDVESQTTDRGSSVQQSDQGRETTVGGNLPLVKASQEQGVTFFSDILEGELYVPKKDYEQLVDTSDALEATEIFNEKRTGNFENHIYTSIPVFKEAQIATAEAVSKTLPKGGTIIDIGGTEGGFINTIAELNPNIEGIVLDPNPKAEESFLKQKLPNTEFIREAFTTNPDEFGKYAFTEKGVDIDYFDPKDIPDNSVDAFSEKMVFQFIDNERASKIELIADKLKPNGFAIFEEKFFTSKEDPVWNANEAKKNEFKSQYYDPQQITEKEEIVLTGMNERQVTSSSFEKILMDNFNNVVQYWDSGNFKGYVASDSADTITKFLNNLEDLNSEYSNVSTPKFVTNKIVEKRRGGSISLPQMNML